MYEPLIFNDMIIIVTYMNTLKMHKQENKIFPC